MPQTTASLHRRISGGASRIYLTALTAVLLTLTTGCLSRYQQRAAVLASATAPVLDQAAIAYRSANDIHNTFLQYDAYEHFGKTPPYKPKEAQPLLSQHDIDVRLALLAAFNLYVQNLVQITSGTTTPQLQAASTALGHSLTGFANTLAPTVEGALGITPPVASTTVTTVATTTPTTTSVTSTTSTTPAPALNVAAQNGISTAVNALGQFLASRKIRKELPRIVTTMDQQLAPLWTLMQTDIKLLQDQELRDYDSMIDDQTGFLLANPTLSPGQRRSLIMQLPTIASRQHESKDQLNRLSLSIDRLALAHHALAADARNAPPETLKKKLADLAAAGSDLGKFYASLPTK